jgi:predicted Rossmann fold nucleotide-binding protein DprA/Smf involved in DNA uptake
MEKVNDDTLATLLLCTELGGSEVKPLTQTEYIKLDKWLGNVGKRFGNLLCDNVMSVPDDIGLPNERLKILLARGGKLGIVIEEWQRCGIWVVSHSDADYPARYKNHLKDKAPPLLYGVGNRSLLAGGGLAIVGSRDIDEKGACFTRSVSEIWATQKQPVVSGGARGVDRISMNTALEAGGTVIGVLSDSLFKTSLTEHAALSSGKLLLLSPYHPKASFSVGMAMGRNKLIYASADYGLVISSDYNKGGTWAGATEELKKIPHRPVFVRIEDCANMPIGNSKLLELGAIALKNPNDIIEQVEQIKIPESSKGSASAQDAAIQRNCTYRQTTIFDYLQQQE